MKEYEITMNRRVFLSGLAGLAAGVAGCGGDSASDPDPTPSPVASFASSPVGVGIYRATEMPPVTVGQFYSHYVLADGSIYGHRASGEPGILTNGGVFTPFEFVSPVSNSPISLIQNSRNDYIVGVNGDAFISVGPFFNDPPSVQPFSVLYEAVTRKTRLVAFEGEPPIRVVAINSRKEIFGYKSVGASVGTEDLFCKYTEGADGLWRRVESWGSLDFHPGFWSDYLLAANAERNIFPGWLSMLNDKAAVCRDGVVTELPELPDGNASIAEASLPDGSVVRGSYRVGIWRNGSVLELEQNTALQTITEDGWIVYTLSGKGYMLTDGIEKHPLVVYHSDGKSRPPRKIMAPLSGRRLLAVIGTSDLNKEKNVILTPTW